MFFKKIHEKLDEIIRQHQMMMEKIDCMKCKVEQTKSCNRLPRSLDKLKPGRPKKET